MRVVTTVHKAGFDQYAWRWVEGIKNWPNAEFIMYAEGFSPGPHENLNYKRTEELPRLQAFKDRYKDYQPVSWEFDIVRFSNKVFAAADALMNYDGLGVWLDADCVTHQKIPDGYIESLLPEGYFMGQFNRAGLYTETGFWVMDCRHKDTKAFFETWMQWFESGAFKQLTNWHDCTTLDATTRAFVKDGRIKVANLSGEHVKDTHPISKVDLGRYIDHCKGPRKAKGKSPENKWRV